ncbi:MAG TPA: HNH endonuclease signature motif containing protein [Anaeromyxobacter sp.]|nr:HNH endonuclease signature motif containing protein [Anaeromyxobacter sp.]
MDNAFDFTKRLQDLLRREHVALAEFLLALAEFDERRLWVDLGHASLFDFLQRELRLSKSASFYRKTAVALVREFPEVAEALRAGKLCLMTVAEVARVLTRENRAEVLPRFFGLSKREAKELAATLLPREDPPLRAVVTPVRAPPLAPAFHLPVPPVAGSVAAPVLPVERPAARDSAAPVAQQAAAPEPPAPIVEPLTAELRRLHVTVTDRFLRKLDAVRAALSHSHPAAREEELLELGLDLLLERHDKRKGLVKKPREVPRPSTNPDHVPAHVSRAVWERDGGKCQWPLASGGVCGSTWRVEIDHITPRAAGGPSTVENCRLACCLCRERHNPHYADSDLMPRRPVEALALRRSSGADAA